MTMLVSTMDIATGMRSFASKRRGDNLQRRSWAVWEIRCYGLMVNIFSLSDIVDVKCDAEWLF